MKVKIISGNEAGQVKEMSATEAEVAIQTGFAEPVQSPAAAPAKEEKKPRGKAVTANVPNVSN